MAKEIKSLWRNFIVQNVKRFLRQREKGKNGKMLFMVIAGKKWQNVQIVARNVMNGDRAVLRAKKILKIVLGLAQFVLGVTKLKSEN